MNVDQKEAEKSLSRRMRAFMFKFRKAYPLSARKDETGHYMLPISLDGGPAYKVLVWSRTPGCAWSLRGGCTFCDFGSDPNFATTTTDAEILTDFVDELSKLDSKTRYLHLGPGGSVLQKQELSVNLRLEIIKSLKSFKYLESFGIETRAELISSIEIDSVCDAVPETVWEVPLGFGLESSNSFIRNVCCNKGESQRVLLNALQIIHDYETERTNSAGRQTDVNADVYVLLKPPFLTEYEAIIDTVDSVNWAFDNGARTVSVFPVVPKPATLSHWLMTKTKWKSPLRFSPCHYFSIFEVLQRLSLERRRRTMILGQTSGVDMTTGLIGCKFCKPNLEGLAIMHNHTKDASIPNLALTLRCKCYFDWREAMKERTFSPVEHRMSGYMDALEQELL